MHILFNKDDQGQKEIKQILGFIDADFNFDNLSTDIALETPYLIEFIGEQTYNLAVYLYDPTLKPLDYELPVLTGIQEKAMEECIGLIQTYILIMANNQYEQSNDLIHTNSGRKMNRTDDQITPWEWQINRDNAVQLKKAYKALDQLIHKLDKARIPTWIASETYTQSKSIFIYNTSLFNKAYPINYSSQLYYKMIPFMDTIELDRIYPILGKEKYSELKAAILNEAEIIDPDTIVLLKKIRDIIAYFTIAKAYTVFPIEMFPDKINYQESTSVHLKSRAELTQNLIKEAEDNLLKLEYYIGKLSETTIERDPMQGLDPENKYVSL